jgi:ATP-binding cassette, subfamily B (MDR/TAP), member 1
MRASSPPDMAAEAATAAEKEAPPAPRSSFLSVFMHADAADVALMLLGLVGAMGDGMSFPATLLLFIRVTNDLGRGPNLVREFSSRINEVGIR